MSTPEDRYDLTAFEAEKRRRLATHVATVGKWTFYVLNALTTFIYGFVSILQRFPIVEGDSAFRYFSILALAGVVGSALLLLLDVARVFWQNAAIAEQTSAWQQGIARGMEIFSLAASLGASVIAVRMLLAMVGLGAAVDTVRSQWLTTTLLTVAITLHFLMGWLYDFMSPAAKARRLASQGQAIALDSVSRHAKLANQRAEAAAKATLQNFMPQIVEEHSREIVRTALEQLQYGRAIPLPRNPQPTLNGLAPKEPGQAD